jgi:hypothetical protein
MATMRQALKDDDPDLNVYGCFAHLLNVLGDDLTMSATPRRHSTEVTAMVFRYIHQEPQLFYVHISQYHEEEFKVHHSENTRL